MTTTHMVKNDVAPKRDGGIEEAMQAVERVMFDIVNSDVTILRDASRHILEAGGKRIRPRLVILSYLASLGENVDKVIRPAAAVELVHTASVVHDDINDHGVVRRGRASVNSIWGRTFALLTGDFLFTKVYELMAPYGELNPLFADATIALVEGETLQAQAVKENNLSSEIYMDIIARKTAALFRMGATMGAQLADATDEQVEALGQYGFNIGLAFQIVDDILDLIGDETKLGKTAGLDLEQGKGLASVDDGDPMRVIKDKVLRGDRIEKGRQQALMLVQAAVAALDVLPDTVYKDALIDLAHMTVDREF
ncbi:MAG: octaprenyl diphosphate synthase [Anaerolineae bacterium]